MDISFFNSDFRNIDLDKISNKDFLYLDPPYLITRASYNENGQWTEKDEIDLLFFLKKLLQKFYENEESKINNFAMNIEICYTDMWYRGLLQKAGW